MTGFKSKKEMAMSKMADLDYDIEQLYIEGYRPMSIAAQLNIPVEMVYDWMESINVAETPQDPDELSPFGTINS
jgi:hypothetical protein